MVTVANAPGILAIAIPALLFLYLIWRQDWEWIGLYVALSFGINAWINCGAVLANLWEPSAVHREPLGSAITGSVMFLGGMVCAMRRPSPLSTLFFALAAMETLFTGVVPIYRFAFDLDQGAYFAFNGQDVPDAIGLAFTLLLAVVPMMIGIPWMLARQSASEKTIIASALSRYGQLSGIGVVAFMTFSTCFVAWGYVGRGPFSGEPQRPAFEIAHSLVGPNMIFGMLMGVIIYLFWSFPKRFFDPVVDLLEASQNINSGSLEDIAHPLWRGLARTLDRRREEARKSMLIADEARAQMQAFLENAPMAMVLFDPATLKIVLMNDFCAAYYGIAASDLEAIDAAVFTSFWEDANLVSEHTMLAASTGESNQYEAIFRKPSGERRVLMMYSFPVFDEGGRVKLVGNVAVDVTEQRQIEAELHDSRAQLLGFFDNLPTSIYLKKIDHTVVHVSKHLAEHYGKRPDEMIGQNEYDLHVDAMKPLLKQMDNHILSSGEAFLTEAKHLQFGRHELVSRFPIFNDAGEITHIGGMNFDIDDRARAQAALEETKALFEAFIQNAPNPMVLMDTKGDYVMVNDAAAAYFGETPEALLAAGPAAVNAHFPETAAVIMPMFARVAETGVAEQVDTVFETSSGEHRKISFALFPIFDSDGKLAFVGNISHDLTRERQAQNELRETKALLQSFVDHVPMALTISDLTGKHVLVNPVAAQHEGPNAESMASSGPADNSADRTSEFARYLEQAQRVVQTRKSQMIEVSSFSALQGKELSALVTFFPLLDSKGEVLQIGTIATDISALREAEEQLAQSQTALHQSEKLAALGSMLAGVSHELNNPLAAVIGQTALLAEDLEHTEHADRISKIRRAADRCARIVQSFLAMARQKAPEYRSVNIADQIRAAIELTEYQMRGAAVSLDVRVADALPTIQADPDQLHQVIVNLLTNARQALEETDGERRITIIAEHKRKTIRLAIGDNGKGIDAATRERIFDPFFTTKAVGTGTGIGLSYSLGIIEAHGGTITIEDAAPGSIFVVTLPVERRAPAALEEKTSEVALAKGRVLVIDDEEDVAETLADMLTRMGLEVTIAIGGKAGMEAMSGPALFDAVLSDVRMPDLDGPSLYAWMDVNRPDLTLKIAFVTGDTLSGAAADFLEKSGCPVLEKPFTPAALRDLVTAMLTP